MPTSCSPAITKAEDTRRSVIAADRVARVLITVGGLATILALPAAAAELFEPDRWRHILGSLVVRAYDEALRTVLVPSQRA